MKFFEFLNYRQTGVIGTFHAKKNFKRDFSRNIKKRVKIGFELRF
jgi:hypothetical protein